MLRSTIVRVSRRTCHGRHSLPVRCFARGTDEDEEAKIDEVLDAEDMKRMVAQFSSSRDYTPDEMELMNGGSFGDNTNNGSNLKGKGGVENAKIYSDEYNSVAEVKKDMQRFANMKGRMWSDSWIIEDEEFTRKIGFHDLPDWTEDVVSRVSRERVKIYKGTQNTRQQYNGGYKC